MKLILEKDGKKLYKKDSEDILIKKYPNRYKKMYIQEEFNKSEKIHNILIKKSNLSFSKPLGANMKPSLF
jgi:hypothetical protein